MKPAVVITGVGTVSGCGSSLDALRLTLAGGVAPARPIEPIAGGETHARLAVLCDTIDTRERIPPLAARRMTPASRHAILATQLAFEQAGCARAAAAGVDPQTSITLATSFGPLRNTQQLIDQLRLEGPGAVSPALFIECVANAPAAQASIHCGIGGASRALCAREAGPLLAVVRAAGDVRQGHALRALGGGVDEITPLLHMILDRFGALARPGPGRTERGRPFDRRRDGFLAAAGATLLLCEGEAAAADRGCRPLARVLAGGGAFDATASRVGWGHGASSIARQLRLGLARAGVGIDSIDGVVSGASGAREGDRLEAELVRQLWPRPGAHPPLVTPKAVTGEYGGAFLAAAVLALDGHVPGPTGEAHETDRTLDLAPPVGATPFAPNRVLVTGLGSGGTAAWLVLERPQA